MRKSWVSWYSQIPAGHPQMPFVGERSKFACLKIYDDTGSSSEDEGSKLMAKTLPTKNKNRGSQKSADKKTDGGLIVHTIPQKLKNRGKKNKKVPVVEDGFLVQEGDEDYLEKKYQEDLQKAIKNSLDMASTASSFQRVSVTEVQVTKSGRQQDQANTKDAVEAQVSDADLQASILLTKTDGPQKAKEQQLVALYRSRLIETLRQLTLENEVKLKAEAEMMKYKSRYKKLCELLKDAEVNEKAHMAADLEKAQKVENELSSQIGELRGELMQARSKIRELEVKNKELASRH